MIKIYRKSMNLLTNFGYMWVKNIVKNWVFNM